MRDALVQIYLHFVWATWDRLPLIHDNENQIYKAILVKCQSLGATVIGIGGMQDHVHLLVSFPATISIANFIKEVKGSTSHLVTHRIDSDEFFKWQGSYAVFSLSEKDVPRIKSYIQNQKVHHSNDQIDPILEL